MNRWTSVKNNESVATVFACIDDDNRSFFGGLLEILETGR